MDGRPERRPSRASGSGPRRFYRAFLSALFPGLGQLAARQYRRAALLGGPVLLLILTLVMLVAVADPVAVATRLIDPTVILVLLLLELAVLVLRLASVLDAVEPRTLRRPRAFLATTALVAFVVVPQLWFGSLTIVAHDSFARIFAPTNDGGAWVPTANRTLPPVDPSDNPFGPGGTTPPQTILPDDRMTVLLIGVDSGVNRETMNTDTMIIASLDPKGKTVSMLSIPRDTVNVPLPDNRTWTAKINSLVAWAHWHPEQFPGAKSPQSVLAAALSLLTGVQIDYWAQVDLQGLISVVNAVGGIDVNVKNAFCDPYYQEYGEMGFAVLPGRYHMSGWQALAYARVRHPLGESDFTRAARQQEVIVALRDRIVSGGFLNDPINLLNALGDTISTDIPPNVISDYAPLGRQVSRSHIYNAVVEPPLVAGVLDERGSVQVPDIAGIRALAKDLFPPSGTLPSGTDPGTDVPETPGANMPSINCYAPKPPPSVATPSPSASGSASPGPSGSGSPAPTDSAVPTPSGSATPKPTSSKTPRPTTTAKPSPTKAPTATPTKPPIPAPS